MVTCKELLACCQPAMPRVPARVVKKDIQLKGARGDQPQEPAKVVKKDKKLPGARGDQPRNSAAAGGEYTHPHQDPQVQQNMVNEMLMGSERWDNLPIHVILKRQCLMQPTVPNPRLTVYNPRFVELDVEAVNKQLRKLDRSAFY